MMTPSDLYRVPRAASSRLGEDLARWAQLEHGASSLAWAVPADHAATDSRPGLWRRLAWFVRRPTEVTVPVRSASLGPSFAALTFEDDLLGPSSPEHAADRADGPCGLLSTSPLILTVQPNRPQADECCPCEQ